MSLLVSWGMAQIQNWLNILTLSVVIAHYNTVFCVRSCIFFLEMNDTFLLHFQSHLIFILLTIWVNSTCVLWGSQNYLSYDFWSFARFLQENNQNFYCGFQENQGWKLLGNHQHFFFTLIFTIKQKLKVLFIFLSLDLTLNFHLIRI